MKIPFLLWPLIKKKSTPPTLPVVKKIYKSDISCISLSVLSLTFSTIGTYSNLNEPDAKIAWTHILTFVHLKNHDNAILVSWQSYYLDNVT
jgi:hypothetical protein